MRITVLDMVCTCFLISITCLGYVIAVPLRNFYPYGVIHGDASLELADDISSPEIQLINAVHYYHGVYDSLFVNSNGHISFRSELPVYQPTMMIPLELNIMLIAPAFADVDLSTGGNVYYRETLDGNLRQKVSSDIQSHFSGFPTFEASGLFVVTWNSVAGTNGDSLTANTFQVVIASDMQNSFVIINYLDNGLQWIQSKGKSDGFKNDPPFQAGFDFGENRLHYMMPYSGTNDVHLLARASNVNEPGAWMYHIGYISETLGEPDLNTGDVLFQPKLDKLSCLESGRQCHQQGGICKDFDTGFCCQCVPPYFGNGKQCIHKEELQRLNGKVAGVINGVSFERLDMHSIVLTKDGRAYTAINRVPVAISSQMMTLNTIGGIIGWLFAVLAGPDAKNGYTYTGGKFNRTARIVYQKGGEVVVQQRYFGDNVQNNLGMETFINGTIPDIGVTEKITMDDYTEEYTKVKPGTIRSSSNRTYRVDNVASRYMWDQVITYEECTHDPNSTSKETMRLTVNRNFVVYSTNDRVVRFAMSNRVGVRSGVEPCINGDANCDANADCISNKDAYSCECKPGFYGDGFTCTDIDECSSGLNTCDENASCDNVPGTFQCHCNPGYRGDGRICIKEAPRCGNTVCHVNATCVINDDENTTMCRCNSGFAGNGTVCVVAISLFSCNEADVCHENADCLFNVLTKRYECECLVGFSGDGLYCEPYVVDVHCNCDRNADCSLDVSRMVFRCICRQEYTGSGEFCTKITTDIDLISEPRAAACNDCHQNAMCVYDHSLQTYRCQCSSGYEGDGTRCERFDCRGGDVCDSNARCVMNDFQTLTCICNPGYSGDGRRCIAESCNVLNNCDVNATCLPDPRDTSRYICRCNQGFTGDGQSCARRVLSCNEVENCDENGQCVYDPSSLEFRCRCNKGYDGDGYTCRPRGLDCRRDRQLCDDNASCMLNIDTFICVCNHGYSGDGHSCQALREEFNYLLFSRGNSIHKMSYTLNTLDSAGSRLLYVPDELVIGLASDCVDETFYWTDVSHGRISRATLDGLSKEMVATGFSSPEGIAIDFLARNIYITDSGLDIIVVVNINGTYRKTLISTNMVNPRGIVLDPHRGMMYWTDWYRDKPTIEQASMDGSERKIFVHTGLGLPNGLTMDHYTQQICWGDAGAKMIECVRTDGVGRRVITKDAPYPFDLVFVGDAIFWSDWTINGIPSVDIGGGVNMSMPLTLPVGGNGRLYGITAVRDFCPRATNACHKNNGGCRYLCLPTPNGGRTCACPDEMDDVTCSEIGFLKKRK